MNDIKRNYLYNVIYQALLFITPFITAPYIARTIGAEGIGIYSYSYSIAYYFYIFGMLGVTNYGNRSIARVQNDLKKRTEEFWNIYIIQLVLGTILSVVYCIYVNSYVDANKSIFWLQIFIPLSAIFDISWFFFGMEEFKIIVPRNILLKVINVLLVIIIVKNKSDLWKYTLLLSLIILITHLALWPFLHRFIGKPKFDLKKICVNIKPDIILFIPILAISLYKVMDKIMLGAICNSSQVGFYENAEKVINIPNGLITAFSTVMLPRMSAYFADGDDHTAFSLIRKSCEFMMFLSCALAFGLYGISTEFTEVFYGQEFGQSAELIRILAITIIAQALGTVMRSLYLIPTGRDNCYIWSIFAGAGINFVLNYILIPIYESKGAAIGTLIAEFAVVVVQLFFIQKELPMFKYIIQGSKYVIIGVIMIYILGNIHMQNDLFTVVVKVLIGAVVYLLLSGIICWKKIYRTIQKRVRIK